MISNLIVIMVNTAPLAALVPLATLLWLKAADYIQISRDKWDQEYDYIVGKC